MTTLQNVVDYLQWEGKDLFENCSVPAPINIETVKDHIMLRCGLLTPMYQEPELFKIQTRMWFTKEQWEFDHLVKILLADYDIIDNVDEWENWTESHSGTDKRTEGGKEYLGGSDTLTHGETHTLSGSDTLTHGETHTLSGEDTLTHGETHTLSGEDTLTHGETHTLSGKDTNADTTATEHTVSAYNSSGYQSDSKDSNSGNIETTYGKKDTASGDDVTEYGKTDTASGDDVQQYGKTDTASGDDTTQYGRTDTASGDDTTQYGKETHFGKTDDLEHGEVIEFYKHRHGNIGVETAQDIIQKELDLLERFNVYDWIARKFERDLMIQVY